MVVVVVVAAALVSGVSGIRGVSGVVVLGVVVVVLLLLLLPSSSSSSCHLATSTSHVGILFPSNQNVLFLWFRLAGAAAACFRCVLLRFFWLMQRFGWKESGSANSVECVV